MTKYEQPTIEKRVSDGSEIERHPAYAQISASRVQGRINLYGSDFEHRHYVIVRIAPSSTSRNLSTDWPHAELDSYIEVALSESQWAQFVSSMNIGDGPRCTLQRLRGGRDIPQLPAVKSRQEQFTNEMRETMREALHTLDALIIDLEDSKIPPSLRKTLVADAKRVRMQVVSNFPFVSKSFGEHVEATTEKARTEINAYIETTLVRAGIRALGGDAPLRLQERMTDNEAIAIQEADADRPE